MSWPQWSAATQPSVPSVLNPAQPVINSAPAVVPPGLQYTPEQWAQLQQQNWNQWAQWQQQYQQWHQQYGAEYQKSINALAQAAQVQPALPNVAVPPPLPVEVKPPPPDEPPPPMPGYNTAPPPQQPPPPQPQVYNTAPLPKMSEQRPPVHYKTNQNQNWQQQNNYRYEMNKRPYEQPLESEPKRPMNKQWQTQPPPPVNRPRENIEELSEAEKKFDKQFADWEAQFNKWKEQNAEHPDKEQYREYEKKWESWRAQLLERREQMKRKRLGLPINNKGFNSPQQSYNQSPQAFNHTQPPPGYNQTVKTPIKQPGLIATPPQGGNFNKPPPALNDEPLKFKDNKFVPETDESVGDFIKPNIGGGIPGLDLVKDDPKPLKDEDVVLVDPEKEIKEKKGPDFDAISKGINTILGDQKLMNMLSIVSQNQNPKQIDNLTNTVSRIKDVNDPNSQAFPEQSNQSYEERSNHSESYGQREFVNNFDDQTRSSFTMANNEEMRFEPPGNFNRNNQKGNRFSGSDEFNRNDRFAPNQDKFPPNQDKFPPNQDRFAPNQDKFPPNQDRFAPNQDKFPPNQDRFAPNQDKFPPNQDRFAPNQGTFAPNQGKFPPNQDRFAPNQDKFPPNQDRFAPNQDQFAPNQDKFPPNQDRFAPNQDRFGSEQDRFGSEQDRFGSEQDRFNPDDRFNKNRFGFNPNQDRFAPNQNRFGGNQDAPDRFAQNRFGKERFGSQDRFTPAPDRSGRFDRFGPGKDRFNKDRFGNNQNKDQRFGGNQDRFAPNQNDDCFDESDDHFPPNQDRFNESDDRFRPNQNRFGPNQQERFGQRDDERFAPNSDRNFGASENFGNDNFGPQYDGQGDEYDYDSVAATFEKNDDPKRDDQWQKEPEKEAPPPAASPPPPPEEIFQATTVIDYEHKANRPVEPEVLIEPIHMFDYRHKALSRIPLPQRPKWLGEAVKNIIEFDPPTVRPNLRRYPDNWRKERYQDPWPPHNRRIYEDRRPYNEPRYEERPKNDWKWDERKYNDDKKPIQSMDYEEEKISDTEWPDDDELELKQNEPEVNFQKPEEKQKSAVLIEDLISPPGRYKRPPRIVIILRGPPGSGKTFLAKLIKDKEVENGGSAPRILSLDDYFMIEQEKEVTEEGKKVKVKEMVYEYEVEMEESYRTSLVKSFKKTITDGYFSFIIVDNVNDKVKYFGEMWSFAKQNGFQVYICQLDLDVHTCSKRNIHGRSEGDIEKCVANWEVTPSHHPTVDATSLLQSASIPEVEMEEVNSPESDIQDERDGSEDQVARSKWDNFDCSVLNLAKLDGVSRPLRHRTMEEYLQLDTQWTVKPTKPGQKRVRWADLEEQKQQEKMRAIGFVVGHTNWDRMMDPTGGSSALTQTKYIERTGRFKVNEK